MVSTGLASSTRKSASLAGASTPILLSFVLGCAAGGGHDDLHRGVSCIDHTFEFMLFGHAEEVIFQTGIAAKDDLRVGPGKLCETVLKDCILHARSLDSSGTRGLKRAFSSVDSAHGRTHDLLLHNSRTEREF